MDVLDVRMGPFLQVWVAHSYRDPQWGVPNGPGCLQMTTASAGGSPSTTGSGAAAPSETSPGPGEAAGGAGRNY
jgi:hypothetical protein